MGVGIDPFLELSSHSPIPKQPVGVCLLLLSGRSWGHPFGQDFHNSASLFSLKVMNAGTMDTPMFTISTPKLKQSGKDKKKEREMGGKPVVWDTQCLPVNNSKLAWSSHPDPAPGPSPKGPAQDRLGALRGGSPHSQESDSCLLPPCY